MSENAWKKKLVKVTFLGEVECDAKHWKFQLKDFFRYNRWKLRNRFLLEKEKESY